VANGNRVLHFSGTSMSADRVYGQLSMNPPAPGSDPQIRDGSGLLMPVGVAFDPRGGLFVDDRNESRVVHFPQIARIITIHTDRVRERCFLLVRSRLPRRTASPRTPTAACMSRLSCISPYGIDS
jgi:hypothetical protein